MENYDPEHKNEKLMTKKSFEEKELENRMKQLSITRQEEDEEYHPKIKKIILTNQSQQNIVCQSSTTDIEQQPQQEQKQIYPINPLQFDDPVRIFNDKWKRIQEIKTTEAFPSPLNEIEDDNTEIPSFSL
ncbi:hypothetical protein pb186bvf_000286 [Paramecium bursaria]